jgi:hypothetical protein
LKLDRSFVERLADDAEAEVWSCPGLVDNFLLCGIGLSQSNLLVLDRAQVP